MGNSNSNNSSNSNTNNNNNNANKRPPPPPLTEADIFTLKGQFLECWTTQDVQAWLKFNSFEEYIPIAEQLTLDGDALILLSSAVSQLNRTEVEGDVEMIEAALAVSPNMVGTMNQLQAVHPESWLKLVGLVMEMVKRYTAQLGKGADKDEKFPPYEYPTFSADEPKNRNTMVMFYHENTQHMVNKGSRAVERRWFSQPRIYRRYFGSPYTKLNLPPKQIPALNTAQPDPQLPAIPYNSIFFPTSTTALPPRPFSYDSISDFFYYALSVSGRRDVWTLTSSPRSAWVKRCNPSSGGLHPIECYAALPAIEGNPAPGVYHYAVRHHGLERRRQFAAKTWEKLLSVIGENSFLIGLSSVHWREVWKYGERGFRYSMLDSGHAYGSLAVSAARLGWKITSVPFLDTGYVESLFGITDTNQFVFEVEKERGLLLAIVNTKGDSVNIKEMPVIVDSDTWEGTPNHMSSDHKLWDIVSMIDSTTAVHKLDTETIFNTIQGKAEQPVLEGTDKEQLEEIAKSSQQVSVESVITSRRSAHDYRNLPITLDQFVHILYSVLKSDPILNFTWPSYASLFIFAYNVTALPPGVYVLVRSNEELARLKIATQQAGFAWTQPENTHSLPLYFLRDMPKVELSKLSHEASCSQNIASQGAFSLGMVVDIQRAMEQMGPAGYNMAHLECGALGQILYLGAHALGLGATGMGCYLDDVARATFGLNNTSYWSLYHFAIGIPTSDSRYAPYDYRENMFAGVLEECVECMRPK